MEELVVGRRDWLLIFSCSPEAAKWAGLSPLPELPHVWDRARLTRLQHFLELGLGLVFETSMGPSSLLHKGIVICLLHRAELDVLNDECTYGTSPRAWRSVTITLAVTFTVTVLVSTGL